MVVVTFIYVIIILQHFHFLFVLKHFILDTQITVGGCFKMSAAYWLNCDLYILPPTISNDIRIMWPVKHEGPTTRIIPGAILEQRLTEFACSLMTPICIWGSTHNMLMLTSNSMHIENDFNFKQVKTYFGLLLCSSLIITHI